MPVQIGAPIHDFFDPTGLLSDCHRRIEMFLGSLDAVAKTIDRPLEDEAIRALESALRYFREAAPKHTCDEEESLFPRLRQVHNPDIESALGKLDSLEQEHRQAAPLHAEIERLGQHCLSRGSLSPGEAEAFRKAVTTLIAMYKEHISVEDGLVFPLAARLLSRTDKAVIANEMASRRKVRLVTEMHEESMEASR
jgi:hemerythrin-like domain-containing protein